MQKFHIIPSDAKHPSRKSHAGSAITIRNNIKHHLHSKTTFDYLHTTVSLETLNGPIQMSAMYSPPKHNFTPEQ